MALYPKVLFQAISINQYPKHREEVNQFQLNLNYILHPIKSILLSFYLLNNKIHNYRLCLFVSNCLQVLLKNLKIIISFFLFLGYTCLNYLCLNHDHHTFLTLSHWSSKNFDNEDLPSLICILIEFISDLSQEYFYGICIIDNLYGLDMSHRLAK